MEGGKGMDEFWFSSKEELYQRIKPALSAKLAELHRLGYPYIQEADIWNYLIQSKWKNAKNLMLCDVVSDILHVENEKVDLYLKEKLARQKRQAFFQNEVEIL